MAKTMQKLKYNPVFGFPFTVWMGDRVCADLDAADEDHFLLRQ